MLSKLLFFIKPEHKQTTSFTSRPQEEVEAERSAPPRVLSARAAVGMLTVLQVCVRRHLWRSACSSAAGAQRGSGAAGGQRGSGAAGGRGLSRPGVRTCTVDPNLEEQFVFLDCTGERAGATGIRTGSAQQVVSCSATV